MLEGRTPITVSDHELNSVSVRLVARMPHRKLAVSVENTQDYRSLEGVVISLQRAIMSSEDSIIAAEDDLAEGPHKISIRSRNPIELPYAGPFIVSAENLPSGDFFIQSAQFQNEPHYGPQIPGAENLVVSLNSRGGSVEGIVVDSTDHPVPGAVVAAMPEHAPDLVDQSRTTTTDQYGQFVLHGLANTAYDIYAWEEVPDGAFYDPHFLADYTDSAQQINIDSGKRYQVKLHAASFGE